MKKILSFLVIFGLLVFVCFGAVTQVKPEYQNQIQYQNVLWNDPGAVSRDLYKMKIQFTGYNKTETLTNFPALVVFTNGMSSGTFQYGQFASTNGWDLWFANESGTELNYEIEQWGTNTNSYVWVQVPTFTNNCEQHDPAGVYHQRRDVVKWICRRVAHG